MRQYNAKNRERIRLQRRESKKRCYERGWREDPTKVRARNKLRDPESLNEAGRRRRKEIALETFAAYGGRCVCCGETNPGFLTIDHVNGNGAAHRREVLGASRGGSHFYRWLMKQGFPQSGEFQLMCYNCNLGRQRNGGKCPHKEQG